jgi:hypothetical protein
LQLLAAATQKVHRDRVVLQPLQVERDTHPVCGRTAEIGIELHSFLP